MKDNKTKRNDITKRKNPPVPIQMGNPFSSLVVIINLIELSNKIPAGPFDIKRGPSKPDKNNTQIKFIHKIQFYKNKK